MIWALSLLLVSLSAQAGGVPAAQASFEQIARQAEAARTGDRLPEAIGLYRQGVKLRPAWSDGWWSLASIYYEEDRFSEAEAAFARFAAIAKNPGPAYAFLGLCEYELRDYQRASQHFRQWIEKGSPGNDQLIDVASYHWALLLTRDGQFFQALYILAGKVERHGPTPLLAEAMGLAWLGMKNVPEDYPPERREMVWLTGMASAYLSALKLDRVHEFQDRLVARYGNEPNVHFFRGYVYELEKNSDEAAKEYRQELKIAPGNVSVMVQLALIDAENAQAVEARSLAKKAISLEPKNPLAHYAMGRVLLADEEWQESARELEIARQLAPGSPKIRFHLARAYKKLGRTADAARENAAFEKLKDKEEVLASPAEKLGSTREARGRTK